MDISYDFEAMGRRPQRRAAIEAREAQDRLTAIQRWSAVVLQAAVLYVFIGHAPFSRQIDLDAVTGNSASSAVNRYVWLGLLAASVPLMLMLRVQLQRAVVAL